MNKITAILATFAVACIMLAGVSTSEARHRGGSRVGVGINIGGGGYYGGGYNTAYYGGYARPYYGGYYRPAVLPPPVVYDPYYYGGGYGYGGNGLSFSYYN